MCAGPRRHTMNEPTWWTNGRGPHQRRWHAVHRMAPKRQTYRHWKIYLKITKIYLKYLRKKYPSRVRIIQLNHGGRDRTGFIRVKILIFTSSSIIVSVKQLVFFFNLTAAIIQLTFLRKEQCPSMPWEDFRLQHRRTKGSHTLRI